jgi:hypothetical protein
MTAVAMTAVPVIDSADMIARAKAILAENRSLTSAEMQAARDDLWRLNESADRIGFATLRAVFEEIDRAADIRLTESLAAKQQEAQATLDARAAARPARFGALPPAERAARRLSSKLNDSAIGLAFIQFAQLLKDELVKDETAAGTDPPDNFEPNGYR